MIQHNVSLLSAVPIYSAKVDRTIVDAAIPHLKQHANISSPAHYAKGRTTTKHILDGVPELKAELQKHVDNYLVNVIGERDGRFGLKITQSWAFKYTGMGHPKHIHGNSVITGVLYFDVKPDAKPLIVYTGRNVTNEPLILMPSHPTSYTSTKRAIQPENYQLLLIPSFVEHEVDDNVETSNERWSLAFDTFPTGSIGSLKNRVEL